jgi:S-adenosyl-l-methionine hydroxide adenosyltransferase
MIKKSDLGCRADLMLKFARHALLGIGLALLAGAAESRSPLVLLTDFGTQDGAVSAMKGVAYSVSQDLLISDLSHENPSIWWI